MAIKNKIYITIALFLLAGVALIALLVYPTFRGIERVSKDVLSKRIEAASMDFQNRELDSFKKKYKEYGPYLESVNQSFIDAKNPVSFITFLEKAANELGIDFDINLNFSPKKEGSDSQPAVVFQIFTKGDFLDILLFSEKLERGPYLVKVNNVSIKKSGKDIFGKVDTSHTLEASFLIEAVSR